MGVTTDVAARGRIGAWTSNSRNMLLRTNQDEHRFTSHIGAIRAYQSHGAMESRHAHVPRTVRRRSCSMSTVRRSTRLRQQQQCEIRSAPKDFQTSSMLCKGSMAMPSRSALLRECPQCCLPAMPRDAAECTRATALPDRHPSRNQVHDRLYNLEKAGSIPMMGFW